MKFNLDINAINYIKFVYKDKDDFSHCIKASIKKLNEREIFACARYDESLNIPVPQNIELSIASDNGLYKTVSVLKFVELDSPFVFFTIQVSDKLEYQQNREFFRVKINEKALISYKTDMGKIVNISGETYDISANGVRISLDPNGIETDIPEFVKLSLYFPSRTIITKSKYIRKENEDASKKIAFTFINLTEPDADYLSQICFKKQLENRRKNWL